ncbi:MAG: VCBS repeat-containing protein [Isosphaeraceae bacterium]
MTEQAGIVDREGRGLGVFASDLDGDGRTDLFVANDTTANYFFINEGGMKFREAGLESGLAANASSGFLAGMGSPAATPTATAGPRSSSPTFMMNPPRSTATSAAASSPTTARRRGEAGESVLAGVRRGLFDLDNGGRPTWRRPTAT